MQKALSPFEKGPPALVAGRDLNLDLWGYEPYDVRLPDPAKALVSVAGVSRRLPPSRLVWLANPLADACSGGAAPWDRVRGKSPVRKATPSYRFDVLRTGEACPMAATLAVLRHHT